MINLELLKDTLGRGLGIGVYGGFGTRKTFGIHTCPYPILDLDIEGGSGSVMPWTRRMRKWNESKWTELTQGDRLQAFSRLNDVNKEFVKTVTRINPGPYIDIISFESMNSQSFETIKEVIGNFDYRNYNTLALDSIHEFANCAQSFTKVQAGATEMDPMHVKFWAQAQERTAIPLRCLRDFRDKGVFIYLTSTEEIHKDYVTDPRSAPPGQAPDAPYSIKGTVGLPGQLTTRVPHLFDMILHAKSMNGQIVWVSAPEALPGGSAYWEAKDRFGRLPQYISPSVRAICDFNYGEENRRKIYASRANNQA